MRHLVAHRKLRRNQGHRKALLRNLVLSLIEKERIITTVAKAKEARSLAEKMITLGKKGTLHHRRLALKFLNKKNQTKKLFDELAPRFSERNGGYTRIIKTNFRSFYYNRNWIIFTCHNYFDIAIQINYFFVTLNLIQGLVQNDGLYESAVSLLLKIETLFSFLLYNHQKGLL